MVAEIGQNSDRMIIKSKDNKSNSNKDDNVAGFAFSLQVATEVLLYDGVLYESQSYVHIIIRRWAFGRT